MAISERHYIIERGQIAWHGTTEELRKNPEFKSQYLGV